MSSVSPAADLALARLLAIRPSDGWAVKRERGGVRLYRRNVPLTDNVFLDIHYDDPTGCVVGMISTPTGANPMASAQVLVESNGSPCSSKKLVQVRSYKTMGGRSRSSTGGRGSGISHNSDAHQGSLTDAQNKELLKFVGIAIGCAMIARIFLAKAAILVLLALPVLYFYAKGTCPSIESFEAKKELKRVLRGHHLPETHPDKPRGMLEQFAARVAASVTTELATLPGYTVTVSDWGIGVILVSLYVPTAEMEYFWIGAFDGWHHVYSRTRPN